MDKEDVEDIYIYIYIYTYTYTYTIAFSYVYENITHIGILLSQKKKNEILPFATAWFDLEGIILNEVNQTEKGKYCMLSLTCRI